MSIFSGIITVSGFAAAMFIAFALMLAGVSSMIAVVCQVLIHYRQLEYKNDPIEGVQQYARVTK